MTESFGGDASLDLRVSDEERQEIVEILREQTTAGRLTLDEFEQRLDDVFASRTRGDLQRALRELPVQPPRPAGSPARAAEEVTDAELRSRYRARVRNDVAGFVVPNFVCNLIWFMGDGNYWWPGWVLLGTGAGLLGSVLRGYDPEREREQLLRERRERAMAAIEQEARGDRGHHAHSRFDHP